MGSLQQPLATYKQTMYQLERAKKNLWCFIYLQDFFPFLSGPITGPGTEL